MASGDVFGKITYTRQLEGDHIIYASIDAVDAEVNLPVRKCRNARVAEDKSRVIWGALKDAPKSVYIGQRVVLRYESGPVLKYVATCWDLV